MAAANMSTDTDHDRIAIHHQAKQKNGEIA